MTGDLELSLRKAALGEPAELVALFPSAKEQQAAVESISGLIEKRKSGNYLAALYYFGDAGFTEICNLVRKNTFSAEQAVPVLGRFEPNEYRLTKLFELAGASNNTSTKRLLARFVSMNLDLPTSLPTLSILLADPDPVARSYVVSIVVGMIRFPRPPRGSEDTARDFFVSHVAPLVRKELDEGVLSEIVRGLGLFFDGRFLREIRELIVEGKARPRFEACLAYLGLFRITGWRCLQELSLSEVVLDCLADCFRSREDEGSWRELISIAEAHGLHELPQVQAWWSELAHRFPSAAEDLSTSLRWDGYLGEDRWKLARPAEDSPGVASEETEPHDGTPSQTVGPSQTD